jgi:ribosomal protein L11 methyltransferase
LADQSSRTDYPALDVRFEPGLASDTVEACLYAALDDFQPIAIQEHETADGWLVFFREPSQRDLAAIALGQLDVPALSVASVDVPDEDWARRSQATLTPITVGRITIAPPWDVPEMERHFPDFAASAADPVPDHIVIVIDPSMGFGTGHHQTTRLCLSLLQSIDLAGRRVIDIGTGSGVLSIAAAALGASSVTAVDNDTDALQNASENIVRNRVSVEAVRADLRDFSAAPADVVVANLTAAALRQHASRLRALVKPGAFLVVSGFSPEELPAVVAAIAPGDARGEVEGDWAAAVLHV